MRDKRGKSSWRLQIESMDWIYSKAVLFQPRKSGNAGVNHSLFQSLLALSDSRIYSFQISRDFSGVSMTRLTLCVSCYHNRCFALF